MHKTKVELEWEVLPHPAYSLDIMPTHYHLFRSLQHTLDDLHFQNIKDIKKCIDNFLASVHKISVQSRRQYVFLRRVTILYF